MHDQRTGCPSCTAEFQPRRRPGYVQRYCSRACARRAGETGAQPTAWEERFWRFVPDPRPDGCWVWTGYHRPPNGYGVLARPDMGPGQAMLAHRASYFIHYGELPSSVAVCHRCDNPPCVNPAHLFAGTWADNNRDKVAKGRNVAPTGARNRLTTIPWATVVEIRRLHDEDGLSADALSKRFGISANHVRRLVRLELRRDA